MNRIRRVLGVRQDRTRRARRGITAAAAWLLVVFMAVVNLGIHGAAATAPSIHPASMPATFPSVTPAVLLVTNDNYARWPMGNGRSSRRRR